jgi:hypothetical protein
LTRFRHILLCRHWLESAAVLDEPVEPNGSSADRCCLLVHDIANAAGFAIASVSAPNDRIKPNPAAMRKLSATPRYNRSSGQNKCFGSRDERSDLSIGQPQEFQPGDYAWPKQPFICNPPVKSFRPTAMPGLPKAAGQLSLKAGAS